ncbi:MAG: hypothetical protein AAB681_02880, partial [Patescibacteria group bacterium]
EPRGAWKILSDSEFFGGNAEQTALRADHIFRSDSDFVFWRWRKLVFTSFRGDSNDGSMFFQ